MESKIKQDEGVKEVEIASVKSIGIYDLFMLALCVYVLLALAVETFVKLPPDTIEILDGVDFGICIIFILDFLFNIFSRGWGYIKWGWIDLVSSIPMIGPLRLARVARLIRIIRLLRGVRSARRIGHIALKMRAQSLFGAMLLLAFLCLVFGSILILEFERDSVGANIKSGGDALWWSFVTITTVGYGDRYPITDGGRIVAVIMMLVGVSLFGIFTAFIASWFTTASVVKVVNDQNDESDDL